MMLAPDALRGARHRRPQHAIDHCPSPGKAWYKVDPEHGELDLQP